MLGFIPLQHAGRWLGAAGLMAAMLGLTMMVAVGLHTLLTLPNGGKQLPTIPPIETANPTFLAPTLDLGATPQWQGQEPVTILLMGADNRPSEDGNGYRPRTDSIMIIRVDPAKKRASMLSIPRDLYIEIPGYGLNRINTAYPLGGADLSVQTVEYNMGVHVDYYAEFEFNVFVSMIDQIGGIDVDVPHDIYDSTYPTYDFGTEVFSLSAGKHHLDGETALQYARSRHMSTDYDRARRQQQIVMAVRDKVLDLNMLPTLMRNAPSTYAMLRDDIDTNMTVDQIISLTTLANDIPRENIRSAVIDDTDTTGYKTPAGGAVEIPDHDKVAQKLAYVFWLN